MRRELTFAVIGAVIGALMATGIFIATDEDDPGTAAGPDGRGAADDATGTTVSTVDPTDTDFGELTEDAEAQGIRVQWTADVLQGDRAGEAQFVTAHHEGTFVMIAGDTRVVDAGDTMQVCAPACRGSSPAEASEEVGPQPGLFFPILRLTDEIIASPDFQITGETELADGIFQRCGTLDPAAFGIELPPEVRSVTLCIDGNRNIPLAVDLIGEQTSYGIAGFTAIADAQTTDFQVE